MEPNRTGTDRTGSDKRTRDRIEPEPDRTGAPANRAEPSRAASLLRVMRARMSCGAAVSLGPGPRRIRVHLVP
eukprot:11286228-Heterocapsa_arctica.AAC.1